MNDALLLPNNNQFILLGFFAAFLLISPSSSEARTVTFGDKNWELNPTVITHAESYALASDLKAVSTRFMLGHQLPGRPILDNSTANQMEEIAQAINRKPVSAALTIEGNWASEFDPGQTGQSLDVRSLYRDLTNFTEEAMPLPILISYPETQLAETNNLGINELVAVGESDFAGSPANRLVNIRVGAKKFNGLILKPSEEFSFNKYLGDVDEANGFLPELVIKKTGLIPELGGGLCQVSSTAFRGAMNAGLPIVERRNHSFAVRYYAPQGTDATIYPGSADLRFTNDLSRHLLIRTRIEKTKLFFEFYSTKDERKIAFEGPSQFDKKPDGSMKAIWTRIVSKNGEEKTQTFRSTYLPPALFTTTLTTVPNPTPPPDPPNPNSNG